MKKLFTLAAMGVLSGLLTACALGEPVEPQEFRAMTDGVPDGAGLFSGEDGEFVLYRR